MPRILGIDLGTTNSCAALFERGRPEVIANAESADLRTLPTVVSLRTGAAPLVGAAARRNAAGNPQFTFTSLKRLLGRRFADPAVQALIDLVPHDVVEGPDGLAWVRGPERVHAPEELLSFVLARLKQFAEAQYGETVAHCVLAIPAYFDEVQKAAARAAATRAGLEPLKLLAEPTAAALAHQLERDGDRTVAVYDFGGGTFDVSILKVKGTSFRVLGMAGDATLGGGDFDRRIAAHLADAYEARTGLDPRTNLYALQRLLIAAEDAKKTLSGVPSAPVRIENLMQNPQTREVAHLELEVSQAELERLCADLIEQSLEPCRQALRDARLAPGDVDEVVLIGGMTRMPAVRRAAAAFFGREPYQRVSPDEAVAIGAAAYAATLTREIRSVSLSEVTPLSIGVELASGRFQPVIRRRASVPTSETVTFTTGEDGQDAVAVRIYQGERPLAADNRHIATLVVPVTPGPAGAATVEVTFTMGQDGVLAASAAGPDGRERRAGVHLATGLSDDQARELAGLEDA